MHDRVDDTHAFARELQRRVPIPRSLLVAGQRHAEADMRRRIPGAHMLVQELDL